MVPCRIILLISAFIAGSLSIPPCTTTSGKKCIFPFKYNGTTYNSCTIADSPTHVAWCAYQVSSDRTAIPGKWEGCNTRVCAVNERNSRLFNACETESGPSAGKPCVFPFKFEGKTHTSCTRWEKHFGFFDEHHGKFWCSTKVDRWGNHISGRGNYGFCGYCDQKACGCHCENNEKASDVPDIEAYDPLK